jgi:predicted enzyme related to lactoylglutathione lyase
MTCCSDITTTLHSVTQVARARAFYEGLLELKPAAAFERGGRTRIEYELHPGMLVITDSPGASENRSAEEPAVAIGVADFEAIVADLRDARVRFVREPRSDPVCSAAIISDPDNNLVAVYSRSHA